MVNFGGEVMNISNKERNKIVSKMLLIILFMTILNVPGVALELEDSQLENLEVSSEETIVISDDDVLIIDKDKDSQVKESKEVDSNKTDEISTENTIDPLDEEIVRVIMEDELLKEKILEYLQGKKGEFSFYIIDPVTGEETMINNRTISSASIIKVFLIVEVHKQIRDGKISFSDKLTLKEKFKVYGSGILRKKDVGTRYSVEYLLHLVITISDNVAANMLADYVGLKNINKTAKELGMDDTTFGHLILEKEKMTYYYGSNTTNAKDLATIMYKIYNYDCLGEEYDKKMIALFKTCKTNSKIPKRLPKTLEIAHKTGSLPLYEHDAGIVYNESRDFIFAAMSNELKSNPDGQLIISTIAKMTYEHMIEKQNKIEIEKLDSFNFNQTLYWASYRIYDK